MGTDNDEQRILITQALPDMVLSRRVELPNRTPLCGAGTKLSPQLINRLMNRGIKRIWVRGHPLPTPSQQPFQTRVAALHKRFSRVLRNARMIAIRNSIEQQMAQKK